jgi:secondary thiamine-phosphate synthase enzyme
MIHEINVNSTKRNELIDITKEIQLILDKTKAKEGLCIAFVPHTTAAILINEGFDESVKEDILNKLNELVPRNAKYKHLEGNSDAHIKASLIGSSILIPFSSGKLVLGQWQAVFFCEFDGPRKRKIKIMLI